MNRNVRALRLSPPMTFLGIKFVNGGQFFAWLGVLVIAILAMTTRSVFTETLKGTILEGLDSTEVLVILLGYYFILLYLGHGIPTQQNSNVKKIEWYLIYFIFAFTLNYIISLIANPTFNYNTIEATMIFRDIFTSILGGYFFTVYLLTDETKAKPVLVAFMIVALLISFGICIGKVSNEINPKMISLGGSIGFIQLPLDFIIPVGGNTASIYLLMFAFIGFAFLLNTPGIFKKLLISIFILSSAAAIFMLATRATLVLLPIGFAFIFTLNFGNLTKGTAIKLGFFSVAVLGLMYIMFLNLDIVLSYLPQFQAQKLGVLLSGANILAQGTFQTRLDQYSAFFDTILTNPLGYGLIGIYPQFYIAPHSLILRLLMISGWLGFIFYYVFIIKITWYWYRRITKVSHFAKPLLISMITLNIVLLSLSWGYDFVSRYGIQLTYFMLCGLTNAVSMHDADRRR